MKHDIFAEIVRKSFQHRHKYSILRPSVVKDSVTGGLFPCSKAVCRCGEVDPGYHRLLAIAGLAGS